MDDKVKDVIGKEEVKVNIKYHKADRTKKVRARIIDLFLLAALCRIFFFSFRSLAQRTPSYQKREERVENHRRQSGIYGIFNGKEMDIVSYYKDNEEITDYGKRKSYEASISTFLSYCQTNLSENDYKEISAAYKDTRRKNDFQEVPMFLLSDGKISRNPSCEAKYSAYNHVYEDYLDYQASSALYNYFPQYQKDLSSESLYRIALELPFAVLLSSFLVYRLPPLLRKRGRKTIGRLIYKIGLVDSRLLHVRSGRFLAYGFIRMLAIIALSFLTFGLPILIDVSRLAFSKKRQDFGEYRLGLYEIDDSIEQIYYSLAEATKIHAEGKKVFSSFAAKDRTDE